MKEKYPNWTDFPTDNVGYGLGAPYCGIGIYTYDKKFSWPDMEYCTEQEKNKWREWVKSNGYEIPEEYKEGSVDNQAPDKTKI